MGKFFFPQDKKNQKKIWHSPPSMTKFELMEFKFYLQSIKVCRDTIVFFLNFWIVFSIKVILIFLSFFLIILSLSHSFLHVFSVGFSSAQSPLDVSDTHEMGWFKMEVSSISIYRVIHSSSSNLFIFFPVLKNVSRRSLKTSKGLLSLILLSCIHLNQNFYG